MFQSNLLHYRRVIPISITTHQGISIWRIIVVKHTAFIILLYSGISQWYIPIPLLMYQLYIVVGDYPSKCSMTFPANFFALHKRNECLPDLSRTLSSRDFPPQGRLTRPGKHTKSDIEAMADDYPFS